MIKVLNLYAGIGGNRKLWTDVEVTAVEIDPKIAAIYQKFFPNDKVIVADAHQYILDHFKEFDFIWSSPPCQTHTVMQFPGLKRGDIRYRYPEMSLYQEVLFCQQFVKSKWVVENVQPYYEYLIKPQESGRHAFWCNFFLSNLKTESGNIWNNGAGDMERKQHRKGFILPKGLKMSHPEKLLNNCVEPELGLHVFKCAFKVKQHILGKGGSQPRLVSHTSKALESRGDEVSLATPEKEKSK